MKYRYSLRRVRFLSFLILLATLCPAQNDDLNPAYPKECGSYRNLEMSPSDIPTAQDRAALKSCNSEQLYFGFAKVADPVAARKCAYLEREAGKREPEVVFGGSGLLTMIYANGRGASRNFDLAIKFACESGWAPAENHSRFKHLLKLKEQNWNGDDFSLCDDATSGFMQGWCADLQENFDTAERDRKLDAIVSKWSDVEKAAFRKLHATAQAFFDTSSENEVDLTGTGRAAFQIEAKAKLENGFVEALQNFERGKLPKFSITDFKNADVELNSVYQRIQRRGLDKSVYGTLTPSGIQVTERNWLKYREAWVSFGRVKYPQVSEDSWRAWLTRERVAMLPAPK